MTVLGPPRMAGPATANPHYIHSLDSLTRVGSMLATVQVPRTEIGRLALRSAKVQGKEAAEASSCDAID